MEQDQPFELFGPPGSTREVHSRNRCNNAHLPGLRFVPTEFTPIKGSKLGEQVCHGIYIIVTDRNACRPVEAGVTIVWTLHKLFGDKFEVTKVENLLQNKAAMSVILRRGRSV